MPPSEGTTLAVNVNDSLDLGALLEYAESSQIRVVAMLSERAIEFLGIPMWESLVYGLKRHDTGVRFELDHVRPEYDLDGVVNSGLGAALDIVMADGSSLGFNDNIEFSRRVVSRFPQAELEVEVGVVGDRDTPSLPTDPGELRVMLDATDARYLAVSIGNCHDDQERRIDLGLAKRLRSVVGERTLVLHGADFIDRSDLCRFASSGPTKINIGPAYRRAYSRALAGECADSADQRPLLTATRRALVQFLRDLERTLLM